MTGTMPGYARPTRTDQALALLARGGQTILAGGTPEPADDPWRGYKLGSYRVYQTLIDRLHEAIR